jgi:hypothetical protein
MVSSQNLNFSNSLSIHFNADGFSLSIFDEANQLISTKKVATVLFLKAQNEIEKIILQETESLRDIKNVRLICESDTYTFVPSAIFQPQNANAFLISNDNLDKNFQIIYNEIPQWDTVNVFSISKTLKESLSSLFPNTPIEHHVTRFFIEKIKRYGSDSVQIWIRPKIMDVVVIKNGGLELVNHFTYQTPEDFTYFTLNIFDQLSLDIENCEVKLYNSVKHIEIQNNIRKYINHVTVE